MPIKKQASVNRYFFLAIIILLGGALFWSLIEFFTAFLAATMFYVISKPFVNWLIHQKKWKPNSAAILVMTISFFIILVPIGVLATMLYQKIISVTLNPTTLLKPIKNIGEIIEKRYQINIVNSSLGGIQDFATRFVSSILNTGINFFSTISMLYFFLYFMIVNTNGMEVALTQYLPFKNSHIDLFSTELKSQTIGNSVGIPLIIIMHIVLAFFAFLIAGVGDPLFWGVITGFASIIPLIGSALVWMPIGIYTIIIGQTWQGCFVIAWGVLVIGVSDNFMRFLLAKKMADVHPIVTVLGVVLGLKYFGMTGLIFGPLIISYFLILLKIYHIEYQQSSPSEENIKEELEE